MMDSIDPFDRVQTPAVDPEVESARRYPLPCSVRRCPRPGRLGLLRAGARRRGHD
jgi:hypothetical protein